MRSLSRLTLLALATAAVLALPGCDYRSKKDTYYLVNVNASLPYWKSVQSGFLAAAAQYGVTARTLGPAGYDPAAEQSAFADAVAAHPAGILVSAAEASALQTDIRAASAAGIPVITVDSDEPNSVRLYFIGTNNLEVGHLGAARLAQRLNGKGNVVFFSIPGQPNIEQRLQGYKEILATKPGIKIAEVVSTAGDSNSAFDRTAQLVAQTGPAKVDAFVCLESSSGKAVAQVLKRNNLTDRVLIAMDVDPDTLDLIRNGTIDATVSQKPYTMGYIGLKALDEAHHGHHGAFKTDYSIDFRSPYPTFIDTGSTLITKDNLSLYEHPHEDDTAQ